MTTATSRAAVPAGSETCWVVTDGAAGTENPCLGLADALGVSPSVKRIQVRAPWRWLPPELWPNPLAALSGEADTLRPPWPQIVIGSGRKAAAPVAAVKRAAPASFAVFVQDPRMPPDLFDAIVAPRHDEMGGANVITTTGALTRVGAERLAAAREAFAPTVQDLPAPRIAVLVGGRSRGYDLGTARARRLGRDVADLCASTGGGAMVTTSRRTPPAAAEALRNALSGQPALVWQPGRDPEPNPYMGFLAWADHILVTEESVTMLSEAAATGRPVHILPMDGGRAKFARFHRELVDLGVARHFDGTLPTWSYGALAESTRVARTLRGWMAARGAAHAAVPRPRSAASA